MNYLLFLLLLVCCTGASSVHGPPQQVLAFAGEDVILPCSFKVTAEADFPTVEWSKEGLKPDVVFLYRDGCETYEMKNPAFRYRTSLIPKELKNRNVSLRISNVRLSDEGKYKCLKLWKDAPREISTVRLTVFAVSEPKLSVVSAESGGVTLQCEANCWLPKPEISLLDDRGNIIPADEPRRVQEASGCFTWTRNVTLRDATKRVTCRVHQPNINQIRSTEILIPADCMRSCLQSSDISVEGAVFLLLVSAGIIVLLWKRCIKSVKEYKLKRKSSDRSTASSTSENHPFLQKDRTDKVQKCTIEKLKKEVADLKSKLNEKEETIHQLQNDLKPQPSPVVCQLGQPIFACGPSKCSPAVTDPLSSPTNENYKPKATASTYSNPPDLGCLSQDRRPQLGISRQNSNPSLGRPFHRNRRTNSSPANLNLAVSLTSSSNASKKKFGDIGRSNSLSSAWPGASGLLASSFNRFAPLSKLSEESD